MKRVTLLLLLVLVSSVAHAEDKAAAEKYFRAGKRAYEGQSFEAAATDFYEAWKHLEGLAEQSSLSDSVGVEYFITLD